MSGLDDSSPAQSKIIGRHLLADLGDISAQRLRDNENTTALLRDCLTRAGFSILNENSHRFDTGGEGFTAVFLLAESHCSIHTYPEHGWLAFDLFSCGPREPDAVLQPFAAALAASIRRQTTQLRCL